jgi:hypothetical protein
MFPIVVVPPDAADLIEQLGTKEKFWFLSETGVASLFKQVRQDTGEDWSEKIACEIASLLGLPHAQYDFATWKGLRGVVTPSFVPDRGRLVHGNELLVRLVPQYPGAKSFRVRQHTLRLVLAVIRAGPVLPPLGWLPVAGVASAVDVFIGYLLLDALIGNTDRHHENWGLVVSPEMTIHLAPTYDHASSLGRNESDETRIGRLTTRDEGWSVQKYVERATSAFYPATGGRALSTIGAYQQAAETSPTAGKAWVDRLEAVSPADTAAIFQKVPPTIISEPAINFAQKMLELNRQRLLELRGSL